MGGKSKNMFDERVSDVRAVRVENERGRKEQ